MKKICVMFFLLATLLAAPASAFKFEQSEFMYLNFNMLMQFQVQAIQEGAPDKASWGKEFFLRRTRLILSGQVTKWLSFFVDTDMPNWGKGNTWGSPNFIVQDAFMTFKVVDEFMVDGGLLIAPFSRHGYQSAVALFGLDYHSDLIKYPLDATNVWRDAGAQLRGYIFKNRLQYRLAIVNGSKNDVLQKDINGKGVVLTNPKDYPRVTAHLRYNILGTETDHFAKGIYFSPKPILSLGMSFDYQQDAGLERLATFKKNPAGQDTAEIETPGELGKYMAVAADVFAEIPFLGEDHEIIVQATFYRYWQGAASKASGLGVFGELGYRYKSFSPIFGMDYFNSDIAGQDLMVIHGGLVWWASKHNVNIKFDASVRKQGDLSTAPFITTLTLQGQMFF